METYQIQALIFHLACHTVNWTPGGFHTALGIHKVMNLSYPQMSECPQYVDWQKLASCLLPSIKFIPHHLNDRCWEHEIPWDAVCYRLRLLFICSSKIITQVEGADEKNMLRTNYIIKDCSKTLSYWWDLSQLLSQINLALLSKIQEMRPWVSVSAHSEQLLFS